MHANSKIFPYNQGVYIRKFLYTQYTLTVLLVYMLTKCILYTICMCVMTYLMIILYFLVYNSVGSMHIGRQTNLCVAQLGVIDSASYGQPSVSTKCILYPYMCVMTIVESL